MKTMWKTQLNLIIALENAVIHGKVEVNKNRRTSVWYAGRCEEYEWVKYVPHVIDVRMKVDI